MLASYHGRTETVQVLLDAGADVNKHSDVNKNSYDYGTTALMKAVWWGHPITVKLLLDVGADVNVRDKDNRSALIITQEKGHTNIVNLLREAGAKE